MHKLPLALIGGIVLASSTAVAWSGGSVNGQLLFYQNQGNFCPTTRNPCTGAKYLESQWHTNMPVSQTKVYIKNMANQVIGQGVTDTLGFYNINWFDPNAPQGPVTAYVAWHLEHKDGRFVIRDPGGNAYLMMRPPSGLQFGIATNLGSYTFGNSGSPNALANLYDGAWRSWFHSLSQSASQVNNNTNVLIKAFDSAACPTSCADCGANTIIMDSSSAFSPQHRILHEMGHIASCRASQGAGYISPTSVCYAYGGSAGWGFTGPEFGSAQFEEAFATFFADVALYGPTATQPHTCLSSLACPNNFHNIETSLGVSCGTDVNRHPINNIRYFWDLYDTTSDFAGENASYSMSQITQAIENLPDGFENNCKNEPWFGGTIDDCDGRSSQDYWYRWWVVGGVDTSLILTNNCGSTGD